jgi:hypothetical protein
MVPFHVFQGKVFLDMIQQSFRHTLGSQKFRRRTAPKTCFSLVMRKKFFKFFRPFLRSKCVFIYLIVLFPKTLFDGGKAGDRALRKPCAAWLDLAERERKNCRGCLPRLSPFYREAKQILKREIRLFIRRCLRRLSAYIF